MSDKGPRLRRLVSKTPSGEPYRRTQENETAILRMLPRPHADWVSEAQDLPSEALVYFVREVAGRDTEAFRLLLYELMTRVPQIAFASAQGLDEATTEHILFAVERQIYDLVAARPLTRQSEFLEVAFGQAVERRTINEVQKHQA